MSRIHGTRAIIEGSIESASLAQITESAKIHVDALYTGANAAVFDDGVLMPEFGGTGIDNGSNTLTMDGSLSFAGAFSTTGSFSTTLVQGANVTLTLPTVDGTLVTQAYVDGIAQSLDIKNSCRAATQEALPAVTYNNGTAGVGATLTADENGVLPAQDGVTMVVGNRLLVKHQAAPLQNGIYVVTALGDASNPFVLTRAEDADGSPANEVSGGMFTFVEQGTASAGHGFVTIFNGNIAVGTDPVNFTQFSGAGQLAAGNGLAIVGNTLAIDADYFDDVVAIDALEIADLVNNGGLVKADLQKLADLDVTANELNELNGAECTYDDFVKLHGLQVSAVSINDLVTSTDLSDTTGAAGASMVGVATGSLESTNVQAALEELQDEIDTLASAGAGSVVVDYEDKGKGDAATVLFTVANSKYIAGSLKVYINGLLMKKGAGAEEVAETSAAAGTFTFGTAPAFNDHIVVEYRYEP